MPMEDDIDILEDDDDISPPKPQPEEGDNPHVSPPPQPAPSGSDLLDMYPEPDWLTNTSAWSATTEDMDVHSRALIESMLAEEAMYFGQGTISVPSVSSGGEGVDAKVSKKRQREGKEGGGKKKKVKKEDDGSGSASVSHKLRWTEEENERLKEGVKLYGFGNWKRIATFIGTRTPLQVKNHARHLTTSGTQLDVPVTSVGGSSKGRPKPDFIKEESADDVSSDATPKVKSEPDMDDEEDVDIDIDITDEEDGCDGGGVDAAAVLLGAAGDSGDEEEVEEVEGGDESIPGVEDAAARFLRGVDEAAR
ncbi:hypothetical protein HK104_000136 [Borealophlyctis nickersoniae]|nr:hypothetical protein HK104_000136 [Borealophlyctis nickersoniae]